MSDVSVRSSDKFAQFVFLCTDYDLHFPNKGTTDYTSIRGMPSLTAFTVCFSMKTSDPVGTPFSYAVPAVDNELTVDFDGSNLFVSINGAIRLVVLLYPTQ